MPQGVAESPEFAYYVGHKGPFFDKINPAKRGAGMDIQDVLSFNMRFSRGHKKPRLSLESNGVLGDL